mmetsp:Transcript_56947/g.64971  ORF Transcript_56947/g.64971 Transcript_56947/m.64971 type:complete len:115 (+) Transcript_56947:40-384(+)
MANQGANLMTYNNELVKCIEDLKERREELNDIVSREEEEKLRIQRELQVLTERLGKIDDSLQKKQKARHDYEKTIQETEGAYMKILESSQTLLHYLKRDSGSLSRKEKNLTKGE